MWTPYKQLHKVVETYLIGRAPEGSISTLELMLQKHKPDFINVLRNSVTKNYQSSISRIRHHFDIIFCFFFGSQKMPRVAKKSKKVSPMG